MEDVHEFALPTTYLLLTNLFVTCPLTMRSMELISIFLKVFDPYVAPTLRDRALLLVLISNFLWSGEIATRRCCLFPVYQIVC